VLIVDNSSTVTRQCVCACAVLVTSCNPPGGSVQSGDPISTDRSRSWKGPKASRTRTENEQFFENVSESR
jgi:hypothetical protein